MRRHRTVSGERPSSEASATAWPLTSSRMLAGVVVLAVHRRHQAVQHGEDAIRALEASVGDVSVGDAVAALAFRAVHVRVGAASNSPTCRPSKG